MSSVRMESSIEGLDKVLKAIKDCDGNVKKSVKGAIRAGGKVIRADAEQRAAALSKKPGRKTTLRVRMRKGVAVASIFPAKGHAELRLLEYGTGAGLRKVKDPMHPFKFMSGTHVIHAWIIHHPGTKAKPWLRPAVDAKANEAIEAAGDSLIAAAEQARIEAEGRDE